MQIQQPLQSKRIQLRCLSEKDVTDFYVSWLNDTEVNQFLEARFQRHSRDSVRDFLHIVNASDDTLILGIFIEEGRRHIGNIKLGPIDPHHRRADIGLLIGDHREWGRGYATEAITLLTVFAFQALGLRKITAGCYSGNKGSLRAFKKAGYEIEACLPGHWQTETGRQDKILIGLSAEHHAEMGAARQPRRFGSVRRLVLIGGGDLMADTAAAARDLQYDVAIVMAPRHAEETLPVSGQNLRAAGTATGARVIVLQDINALGSVGEWADSETLALCFGPAWIFSPSVIGCFGAGMLNFNGIPIPHYLGGAHYTWQILNGNRQGGCFLQEITPRIDRGDILRAEKFDLPAKVTTPQDYFAANYEIGRRFIRQVLNDFRGDREFHPIPFNQVNAGRLYFPRLLARHNAWIDWGWSGHEVALFCQAFDEPYMGAATHLRGNEVRLKNVELVHDKTVTGVFHSFVSGLVVRKLGGRLWIAVTDGLLQVEFVGDGSGRNLIDKIREGDRFATPPGVLHQARTFRPVLKAK